MPLEATGLQGRNLRGKWAGGQVNTPLPGPSGRRGRVLARPTSHPKLLSRPQAVPTFLDLLVHLAWLCPSPRGGGGLQLRGNAISRSPARGGADHEKLSPSRWPLARPEPSRCLRVPGGNRVASHYPRTGDGAWEGERVGGERERLDKPALGDRGNWTGLAAGKGRRGAAQPGRWAGALLPAGSGSALRGAGFQPNSLPPAAAPVSHEKERSSFSGRESESGGSGSGAEDCRRIRVSPPPPPDHPAAAPASGHGNPGRSCPAVRGVPTPPRARPGFCDPHSPAGSSQQRCGRGGATGRGLGREGGARRGDRPCSVQQPQHWWAC